LRHPMEKCPAFVPSCAFVQQGALTSAACAIQWKNARRSCRPVPLFNKVH
jgi:hypothetical protein